MKKFLTVFFMSILFGAPAFADHHEGEHTDDVVVEGDVQVEGDHHDGEHADEHGENHEGGEHHED